MKTRLNLDGLNKVKERTKDLNRKSVPIDDLMPGSFMSRETKFSSFGEFFKAGGFHDADDLTGEAFSHYVRDNTRFGSWEDMKQAAGREYVRKKILG